MTENSKNPLYTTDVQAHLQLVQHLLDKYALVMEVTHQQALPTAERHELEDLLLQKHHLSELEDKLNGLHTGDIAFILEALPLEQRLLLWDMVKTERNGEILIGLSHAVRKSLLATMGNEELREATGQLDTDKIADLAPDLPPPVMHDVFKSLSLNGREQLRAAMSYPPNTVGSLMDFNMVTIRADVTLEAALRYLHRFNDLPAHTDQLFVVNRDDLLQGVLPLNKLLVNETKAAVSSLMVAAPLLLRPDDKAHRAAQAFERYRLISAPVVDEDGKLLGRMPISTMVSFIRNEAASDTQYLSGLQGTEDIFASVWKSVQNRWMWLALNLCAAFLATQVIGHFAGSIEKLVALAALMPIIAGIAGNAGNQTIALIIHFLAQGLVSRRNARQLLAKELTLSSLNGLLLGGIAGGFAYLLYSSVPLSLVVSAALLLNLLLGALAGMLVPLLMHKFGRNPAQGSSVLLTAITNSGGFFIFLGLAALFLIH